MNQAQTQLAAHALARNFKVGEPFSAQAAQDAVGAHALADWLALIKKLVTKGVVARVSPRSDDRDASEVEYTFVAPLTRWQPAKPKSRSPTVTSRAQQLDAAASLADPPEIEDLCAYNKRKFLELQERRQTFTKNLKEFCHHASLHPDQTDWTIHTISRAIGVSVSRAKEITLNLWYKGWMIDTPPARSGPNRSKVYRFVWSKVPDDHKVPTPPPTPAKPPPLVITQEQMDELLKDPRIRFILRNFWKSRPGPRPGSRRGPRRST
jgi:hypothetical protein